MDSTDYGEPFEDAGPRYPEKTRVTDKRMEVERQLSSRWSREELEDKYLRLYAENSELREHKAKQQEKIKILTTKLERLFQDRKKLLTGDGGSIQAGQTGYNVQELQDRVSALQAQNEKLKAKVDILNNQLKNQSKGSLYSGVTSKINTGVPKVDNLSQSKALQQTGTTAGMRSISPLVPKATRQMIEDLRSENTQLRAEIARLHHSLEEANDRVEDGNRKLSEASVQYQEDLNRIKQSMGADQRSSIRANIEQVKMQRDLKDKSARLQITTEQLRKLEMQAEQFRINEQQLKREVDKLQTELRLEQERRVNIHEELKSTSAVARTAPELETRLSDIARENIILKETNDKLTQSAFDVDRERGFQDRESAYRIQIQQLEATLKADVGEKTSILERLTEERAHADKIRQELKEERTKNAQMSHELDVLQDKMKIFSKASAVDFDELGEALMLIRERKRTATVAANEAAILKSVAPHAQQGPKDWRKLYEDLEIVQAETVNELDRTRAILSVQYRINKDYAQEVEATTRRLESIQAESEGRLQEYAKLLDLRLARIRKLEGRLRDLAYGVRPLRPMAMVTPAGLEGADQKGELESGQNLFEIHLDTLRLSDDTVRLLGEPEISLFCTWGFFEFELQKSPVVRSYNRTALFDCTSQYVVTVDDFLLSYLAHRPLIIELHRARGGLDYETIAVARVSLKELLDSPEPTCRMAGTAPFTGMAGVLEAIQVAELDFWVLLRVPMQHAFRLFRERLKAMNYLVSDAKSRDTALAAMDTGALAKAAAGDENVNILHVHIVRCQGLVAFDTKQASKPASPKRQPSAYVAYKFLDYPEHVTATVPESAVPQFNDHHSFTLYTTADTDRFLKTETLNMFVFDDVSPDNETTAYLGRARIPLIALANNHPVQGLFELTRADGTASGVIEVRLSWQFLYRSPSNLTMVPPPKLGPDAEIPEVPVRDVDAAKLQQQLQQTARPQTSVLLGKTVQTGEAQADIPQPVLPKAPEPPVPQPVVATPIPVAPAPQVAAGNIQLLPEAAPVIQPVAPVEALPAPPPVEALPAPPDVSPPQAAVPAPPVVSPPQVVSPPVVPSKGSESGSQPEVVFESDSEGVVVETSRLPKSVRQSLEQVVSITIHSLRIKGNSSVASDDHITQLFIAFDFDGISQDELETPLSLPKPTGGAERDLVYNFTKVIQVSPVKNPQNRAFLEQLLTGDDRRACSIVFSVVSESVNSDECEDIGEVLVDARDILNRDDVREKEYEVRSTSDQSVIGSLKLTVICRDVLRAIKQDLDNPPADSAQPRPVSSSPTV